MVCPHVSILSNVIIALALTPAAWTLTLVLVSGHVHVEMQKDSADTTGTRLCGSIRRIHWCVSPSPLRCVVQLVDIVGGQCELTDAYLLLFLHRYGVVDVGLADCGEARSWDTAYIFTTAHILMIISREYKLAVVCLDNLTVTCLCHTGAPSTCMYRSQSRHQ